MRKLGKWLIRAWTWFGHATRLNTLLQWLGLYPSLVAAIGFVGSILVGWWMEAPAWQTVPVGLLLTVAVTKLVFHFLPPHPPARAVEGTESGTDEYWTFWRAANQVMGLYGDELNGRRFPADEIMNKAARSVIRTDGVRAADYAIMDDMGLNHGPHEPIDPAFWRQNEIPIDGYLTGSEATARRVRTVRRKIAHYDWSGGQFVDVRIHAGDLKKVDWNS